MSVLLTTLNARFIQSCLAIYYLKGAIAPLGLPTEMREFTINLRTPEIVRDIYRINPQLVGFSVYIWNREQTLEVCGLLKKVMPGLTIVLGGPEVSFDSREILAAHQSVDYIVTGEGEETFPSLLQSLIEERNLAEIPGLTWRNGALPVQNGERKPIEDLDIIPFPYDPEIIGSLKNRIIYYETSRGCPFGCSYCLSSIQKGMRYFSLSRVKENLQFFIQAGVKQVKFVDRTFNCHLSRTKAIISYLLDLNPTGINFHFEIAADILDDELVALLASAPAGLFQLEIGVQSTNPAVLANVGRKMDFAQVADRVSLLRQQQNLHLHLDLIAGLPGEDLASFEKSFNDVFALLSHQLQLGFLKVLKGTELRQEAGKWGLIYADRPPYEILATDVLPFSRLLELKSAEGALDRFYNSGRFRQTLIVAATGHPKGPLAFFLEFGAYLELAEEAAGGPFSEERAAKNLRDFLCTRAGWERPQLWEDLMKLDRLLRMKIGKKQKTLVMEDFSHQFIFKDGWLTDILPGASRMLFDYSRSHPVSGYPQIQTISDDITDK